MAKRRIAQPVLAILIVVVLIGASLGFATIEPTSEATDDYAVSRSPGTYRVTMERFKRHGPEMMERGPFQLENSLQIIRYRIKNNGSLVGLSHSIKSSDERSEYLLELAGRQYSVRDLKTGALSDGPKIPETNFLASARPLRSGDLIANLENAGLTRGSDMVWRGRNVVVYEAVGPIIGQLSAPEPSGVIGLPVIYDLSPVSQRAGVYVDTATNRVVRTYRYAIDSSGDETLIESLDILSIEREKSHVWR